MEEEKNKATTGDDDGMVRTARLQENGSLTISSSRADTNKTRAEDQATAMLGRRFTKAGQPIPPPRSPRSTGQR